jgi:hypothetical protein
MPLLIAYLLAVAIFVGGGYGTLYWLTQPEPEHLPSARAMVPPPDRSPRAHVVRRAEPATATQATQARAPEEIRPPAAQSPSGPAATTGDQTTRTAAGVASAGPDATSTARPAAGQNDREHDDSAAAPSAVIAATPAATDGAAAEATAEGATAETAGSARSVAAEPAGAKSRKRTAGRTAQRERAGGYRVMMLRTVELPDGSRRSFLVPPRRGFAFSGNVDDDED